MKTITQLLCLFFLMFATMQFSVPLELVSSSNELLTTENQCCCKGKKCNCAAISKSDCKVKEISSSNNDKNLLVIKGAGCDFKEKGHALSPFSKPYYLAQTNTFSFTPKSRDYRIRPFLEINSIIISPLKKPPKLKLA